MCGKRGQIGIGWDAQIRPEPIGTGDRQGCGSALTGLRHRLSAPALPPACLPTLSRRFKKIGAVVVFAELGFGVAFGQQAAADVVVRAKQQNVLWLGGYDGQSLNAVFSKAAVDEPTVGGGHGRRCVGKNRHYRLWGGWGLLILMMIDVQFAGLMFMIYWGEDVCC